MLVRKAGFLGVLPCHDAVVKLWDRLMDWDKRVSRRIGLRFDDPTKSAAENIRRAQHAGRNSRNPPVIVSETEFVSEAEAVAAIGGRLRRVRYCLLVSNKYLQPCFVADGRQGVTRAVFDAEMRWRRTASRRERLDRAVRIAVREIANGF